MRATDVGTGQFHFSQRQKLIYGVRAMRLSTGLRIVLAGSLLLGW
jgi:hypothetical protein